MTTIAAQNTTAFAAIALWGQTGSQRCGCGRPDAPSNPSNASTTMSGGKVCFENDSYTITAGDDNSVTVHNKQTGETYQVWGDPHVNVDGQHAFDFWGTTTFQLDDGTKVTIQTTPWAGNPDMTVSSKVTITNGDYGVQITGVDSNQVGDLKFEETQHFGGLLDRLVADGNTLHENPAGKGFLGVDSEGRIRKVDQQYINETDLQKGGQLQQRVEDLLKKMSGLMAVAFVGGFLAGLAAVARRDDDHCGTRPVPLSGPRCGNDDDASGGYMLLMSRSGPNMSWFLLAGGTRLG